MLRLILFRKLWKACGSTSDPDQNKQISSMYRLHLEQTILSVQILCPENKDVISKSPFGKWQWEINSRCHFRFRAGAFLVSGKFMRTKSLDHMPSMYSMYQTFAHWKVVPVSSKCWAEWSDNWLPTSFAALMIKMTPYSLSQYWMLHIPQAHVWPVLKVSV